MNDWGSLDAQVFVATKRVLGRVHTAVMLVPDALPPSFEHFVRTRSSRLLAVAVLLCGDRGHAEDLLQAALAGAARRWDRIEGSPEAYVRAALVNGAKNRWRKRRPVELPLLPDNDVRIDDDTRTVDLRRALIGEIGRLPPRQRAVLVLRYFADLTEAETARELRCSVGTVKSQTARAFARLRSTTLRDELALRPSERTDQ
jgi:RNA polymerase sigma-70 factor (sigma-E family)